MRTLLLLRHAKSSWEDDSLADFDRPLASRGRRACAAIGTYIRRKELLPDHILSSTAVRARETCELVSRELRADIPTTFDRDLYLASPKEMLRQLAGAPKAAERVMLIGHDPGMHQLAVRLIYGGDARSIEQVKRKFPTAALAEISLEGDDWRSIDPMTGRLHRFVRPRELE